MFADDTISVFLSDICYKKLYNTAKIELKNIDNWLIDNRFKFKTAQNGKNLRLNGHTSFESQTLIDYF